MRTVYYSDDNKRFETEEACKKYEEERKKRLAEQDKLAAERNKRYQDIIELIEKFNKDYDTNYGLWYGFRW